MTALNYPLTTEFAQPEGECDAEPDDGDGGWNGKPAQEGNPVPDQHDGDGQDADRSRAGLEIEPGIEEFRKGVLVVRLQKRIFAHRVGIVTEDVRELLENQGHADRREQALDDTGRNERSDESGPEQSERDLHQACDHHGEQKGIEGAQLSDLRGHDRRQAGRGTGDARV